MKRQKIVPQAMSIGDHVSAVVYVDINVKWMSQYGNFNPRWPQITITRIHRNTSFNQYNDDNDD